MVEAHSGYEVDSVGDELLAAFSDPARAAAAALAVQRELRDQEWPGERPVRVRIGLHCGTPTIGVEGYTGVDVVRASRIANAGHGGQILASAATLEGLDSVATRDIGEYRLEGLPAPERIVQLLAEDLPRWVESKHRGLPAKASRGITGISMGGFGAFKTALQHPGIYGTVSSVSGLGR